MHIIQKYCRYGAWTNKPHILCYYNVIISLSLQMVNNTTDSIQIQNPGDPGVIIMVLVFISVFLAFLITSNIFFIVCIARCPWLQTAGNFILVNLAVADLAIGVYGLPMLSVISYLASVNRPITFLKSRMGCLFGYFFQVCPLSASQMSLLLASAERYLAIQNPFRHEAIFTKRMVAGLCVGMWLYSIIYHSLPLLGWNQWDKYNPCSLLHFPLVYIFITHLHYCFFLLSIIGLYSKMLLIAHQQTQKIAVGPIGTDTTSGQRRFGFRAIKAARTIIIVVGCFICLTIPYVVMAVIMTLYWHNDKVPSDLLNILSGTSTYLLCVNSAINPIIYGVTMRPLRQAMKRMLCSCNSSGRTQIVSTINSTRRE